MSLVARFLNKERRWMRYDVGCTTGLFDVSDRKIDSVTSVFLPKSRLVCFKRLDLESTCFVVCMNIVHICF